MSEPNHPAAQQEPGLHASPPPGRDGYLEEGWRFARDNAGPLAVISAAAYATGWFAQVTVLDSLQVGELTPSRERTIITGGVMLFLLWPILAGQILVKWRRLKKRAWIEFGLALLTLTAQLLIVSTFTIQAEYLGSNRHLILAVSYLLIGGLMAAGTYRSKKSFLVVNSFGVATLMTIFASQYAFIAKPSFGGLRSEKVLLTLEGGIVREFVLLGEDQDWIIVKSIDRRSSVSRVAKSGILSVAAHED